MGFEFAATLAGRYPKRSPTSLETTRATATTVQERRVEGYPQSTFDQPDEPKIRSMGNF
jgi:hypothetical protein